jgi:hypothetical protein
MVKILQVKVNWKSAYCRLHQEAQTAIQSMVTIGIFVLIALHLTFGGASNPSQWSNVSEMATNLANDIVQNDGWDPDTHVFPTRTY